MNINPDNVKVILTPKSIMVQIENKKRTFQKENPDFPLAQLCVLQEKWEELYNLIQKEETAKKIGLEVKEEKLLTPEGKSVHPTLKERIADSYTIETLQNFQKLCRENVWPSAIDELLCFLKDRNLPLTKKGTFLAWKSIRKDYTDHRTGTVNNRPGQKPKMERDACEPSRAVACSTGYHAGTHNYASGFHTDKRLIIVEVSPAAVTSVPLDSGEQKLRCDEYLVLTEFFPDKDGNPTEFISKLAEKPAIRDQEETTLEVAKKQGKAAPEKKPEAPVTKRAVLDYALHLKKTKKGDGYVAAMVKSKFTDGIRILQEMITNEKNPQRLNKATKDLLGRIIALA